MYLILLLAFGSDFEDKLESKNLWFQGLRVFKLKEAHDYFKNFNNPMVHENTNKETMVS
jgi:hypothetical protein